MVFFNVDYRLAPETKCPHNVLDFYCAIKHILENAAPLGLDPSRIAIAGESGGGYICAAAMVMLAQKGEGSHIKLAVLSIPMLSDYCFGDTNAMKECDEYYREVVIALIIVSFCTVMISVPVIINLIAVLIHRCIVNHILSFSLHCMRYHWGPCSIAVRVVFNNQHPLSTVNTINYFEPVPSTRCNTIPRIPIGA